MNAFVIFFRVFRKQGWPHPYVFLQGLVPLLIWHLTGALWPGVSDEARLSWAVLFFFSFVIWSRLPENFVKLNRERNTPPNWQLALAISGTWLAMAAFAFLTQEQGIVQHWLTFVCLLAAFVDLFERLIRTGWFGDRKWSKKERAENRPTFLAVNFLFCVGFAILNETFIRFLSLDAWVVWLSLAPLAMWIGLRTITLTVAMSLDADET